MVTHGTTSGDTEKETVKGVSTRFLSGVSILVYFKEITEGTHNIYTVSTNDYRYPVALEKYRR